MRALYSIRRLIQCGVVTMFAAAIVLLTSVRQTARADEPAKPIEYDAITDRVVRAKPPLPAMGAAGSVIKDPTFGSRILRVTDPDTLAKPLKGTFFTTAGSFVHAWGADSRRFFLRSENGVLAFDFDPEKFAAKLIGTIPLDGPVFSGVDKDIVFGLKGRTISAYSFADKKTSAILDLETIVPKYPQYQYAVGVSADDTKFAVSFSGIQDTFRYLLWYDHKTGARHLLDLQTSTLDGKPAPITFKKGAGIHSQDIDRSGRYVSFCGPEIPGRNACFWDVEKGTMTPETTKDSGHSCLGFGYQVNQGGIQAGGTSDGRGFILRSLAKPNEDLKQLVSPPPPPPYAWSYGGHWSWGSARPDVLNPVVGSYYRDPEKRAWSLWDEEVVGIRTDGKESTVWRFCHNRSDFGNGKNFWDCPRGNLSPDGRWFIFTSNWEKTLGKNSKGETRQDVFLVELKLRVK